MSSNYSTEIAQRLIQGDLASTDELVGCSDADIADIESAMNVKLPTRYKDFLQTCGREAGTFLEGSDFLYPDLLNFRRAAEIILEEEKIKNCLSKNHFVFWLHQGYQFAFFDVADGNDPAVFYLLDTFTKPKKIADSFSEWLDVMIEGETSLQQELTQKR